MAPTASYDAIIIGSGFGGSLVAHALVGAGQRVLMLERGGWVTRGPHNWAPEGTLELSPFYSFESPYRALAGGQKERVGAYACVGGPSVFYGGVSFRLRQADFTPPADIVAGSGARWPWGYAELEPWYTRAERLLHVSGQAGEDPTEPPRSAPYPQAPGGTLARTSARIRDACLELNLRPFRLPLAISYADRARQKGCVSCTTCDTFACAIGAKNDLATCVLPALVEAGMELRPDTVVTRLLAERGRVEGVECQEKRTGATRRFRARRVVLAAGALGSPHLLLASRLERLNPAGGLVGRYLTRHSNAIVFGLFPWKPLEEGRFHKQLGIHDFYFGDPECRRPEGKLGSLQQLATPPAALARAMAPRLSRPLVGRAVEHLTGLLVMAEDQPRHDNHVAVDWGRRDGFGLPQLTLTHRYTRRDVEATRALVRRAKQILRRAGALAFYVHPIRTFSHAVGTVRMGEDPRTSVLDGWCRFRGVEGLYVVDGSFMPSSAGLNPSLTIAANALRVGAHLVHSV